MKKTIFFLIYILIFNYSYSQDDFNTFHRVSKNIPGIKNVKVKIYGDFSISYQNLNHESALRNSMGKDSLPSLSGGFNNAQGNLGFVFDLYDGITIDLLMNLSTYHHTEAFMREGWIKIDKLTMLNSDFVDKMMEYVTIKAGQMEINYGDWHLRRSNSGAAFNNPLVGNYIVDANTTEIAFEVYVKYSDWLAMIAFSDGNTTGVLNPDWNLSLYGKLAWDKEINEDLRLRLSGSVYRANHENTSTATVLYRGNRSGARYRGVMRTDYTSSSAFTNGQILPGVGSKMTAYQFNPYLKWKGLELFGILESTKEDNYRQSGVKDKWTHFGGEMVYYLGKNQNYYLAARYSKAKQDDDYIDKAKQEKGKNAYRYQLGIGYFLTKNILLKGEYVKQNYKDFPVESLEYNGKFNGFVIEAAARF